MLGAVDDRAGGWRLYKWALSIPQYTTNINNYNLQKWISAQLLATIENQGVRKFVIGDGHDDDEAILV